MTRHNIGLNI